MTPAADAEAPACKTFVKSAGAYSRPEDKAFMTDSATRYAPGWPGIPPRWTSSAKTGVGTALNQHSKVWFTLSHGILNEVYFPRVDQACTRDMGFIVTDGNSF